MGNVICGKGGQSRIESRHSVLSRRGEGDQTWSIEELDEQRLDQLVQDMKTYHQDRLRHELETDPHSFILDNLLMCIQFFDNFDKAVDEANQFKWDTEREMTELLSKDPVEGAILGDRRIKLLTGMSHVLAQSYIYRGKHHLNECDEADLVYGGMGFKDTFMAEGILPLDFDMTWENLELYDATEWNHLREYSDPKGASPISRFCMEQPDKKTNFPKGYLRLRCVDEPIPYRRKLDTPPSHPLVPPTNFDYDHVDRNESIYSKPDDHVSEIVSESDEHPSGPTSDEDDDINNLAGKLMAMQSSAKPFASSESWPSTSKAALSTQIGIRSRPKLQKLNLPPPSVNQQPSFVVHEPTPPVLEATYQTEALRNLGLLHPQSRPGRILNQHHSRSAHISSPRDSPGKETSSGYDTISTMSRNSSMASEMVRDKWQKLNLKRLCEYGKKSRKESIVPNGKYDPIPPNCYSEIKYEFSYDDPIEEEDEFDLYDSEDESDEDDRSTLGLRRKGKKKDEDFYEMRIYLNSSQFSSNACSEFHYIGPKISIPSSSLQNAVVLGTTIRCPIPYSYPTTKKYEDKDNTTAESYYVTHTFTPSLHSKTWPSGLRFTASQNAQNNLRGEMWPSPAQMEQIDFHGCNVIPLGFRSMDFFNAEQILEWELNFHDCEISLLNSFRHPHWRAYIFASVLYRAFMAPLGPQGVGLEHIRNVLYFMCHENFTGWEDEQPGLHVKILLDNLFGCLSRTNMPSFFLRSRNLLQSIPEQNLRFVQGHLKQIRENPIIYSIYAFRNLLDVRRSNHSFPYPKLKKLYEILIVKDAELLKILNPPLRMRNDDKDEENAELEKKKAKKKKKKRQRPTNLLDQQDSIDRDFFIAKRQQFMMYQPPKRDPVKERLQQRHKNYLKAKEKQEEETRRIQEAEKLQKDPEHRIPDAEKRKSIDLKKSPVIPERFTPFRLLLVVEFFIKQFLRMAEKAVDLQNYGQATMYVLQVENLWEIAMEEKYKDALYRFDEEKWQSYRESTLRLRHLLGKDMHQYVLPRLITPSSPTQSRSYSSLSRSLYSPDPSSPTMKNSPSFTNNWDLRKLPTPPPSVKDIRPSGKTLGRPDIVSTLQSLENMPANQIQKGTPATASTTVPVGKENTDIAPVSLPTEKNRVVRRQESIKFVSSAVPKQTPPATPPRSTGTPSRPISRQSTMSMSLDMMELAEESTDL